MPRMNVWIEPLGWMLIHSVWLIAVIVVLTAVALIALRRRSANARYLVGCVSLLLSLGTLPAVLAWVIAHPAEAVEANIVSEQLRTISGGEALTLDESGEQIGVDAGPDRIGQPIPLRMRELQVDGQSAVLDVDVVRPEESPVSAAVDQPTFWERVESRLRPHLPVVVVVWLVGVVLLSARPLIGWHSAIRLQRVGLSEVSDSVKEVLSRLAERIGLRRAIRIWQSSLVQIPCVVGAFKPVILLPASALTGLSADQLEALLAHELAHIRRHDFAVNFVQTLVETLLFYHPAIWWLSRRVRQEREHCCDDLAISICGDVAGYARMLVSIEGLRGRVPQTSVAASGGSLVERVRRLLPTEPRQVRAPWLSAIIVLVTLAVLIGSWQGALGQRKKLEEKPDKYAVRLPNGATIELIGVGSPQATSGEWWRANGTRLLRDPRDSLLSQVSLPKFPLAPNPDSREFAVRVTGVRKVDFGYDVVLTTANLGYQLCYEPYEDSYDTMVLEPSEFTITNMPPMSQLKSKTVKLRIGMDELSDEQFVRSIGPDGKKGGIEPGTVAGRRLDELIQPIYVRNVQDRTELALKWARGLSLPVAYDKDTVNQRHDPVTIYRIPGREIIYQFPVPLDRLDHIEFRLKKYRHWVTFENVSLNPGEVREVKVSVESLPEEQPAGTARKFPAAASEVDAWVEELASDSAERRVTAAAEVARRAAGMGWLAGEPVGEVDQRLIHALAQSLGRDEMVMYGNRGQRVGAWCQDALKSLGSAAVSELIAVTGEGDAKARGRAAECLGAIKKVGPKGVEALIALLAHPNYEAHGPAASALKELVAEPSLVPKLIEASERGELKPRSWAVGVLGRLKDDRVDAVLLKSLDAPERDLRLWAAYAVSETPRPKLAEQLIARVKTDDLPIRQNLETALRKTAKSNVPALVSGLKDDDPRVRATCVFALAHLLPDQAPQIVPALTAVLNDDDANVRRNVFYLMQLNGRLFDADSFVGPLLKGLSDPDADLRKSASGAFQRFAEAWPTDRRPIEPLLKALDDSETEVVANAIRALAEFRESKAVPHLVRLAGTDGNVGAAASAALGVLRDPGSRDVLRRNMAKKQPAAIEALGKIHDRESIPRFIELLSDGDEYVRTAAAQALTLNSDSRAVEPLIAGLKAGVTGDGNGLRNDRNNSTLAIADALGRIGDPRGIAALVEQLDEAMHFRDFIDDDEPSTSPYPRRLDDRISNHPFAWPLFRAGLPALPELAKGLASPSVTTRKVCAWVLDNLASQGELEPGDFDSIRPALLTGLRDSDAVVRYCLVKTVGDLKLADAEPILLELLESPLPKQSADPSSHSVKLRSIDLSPPTQIQVEVIRAMFGPKTDRARDTLLRALQHSEPAVRSAAAGHLGGFPAAVTVEPLIKALSDPGASAQAARVLGHLGDPRAIAPLIELLKSNPNPQVQANAAQSLGLLGAADAKPALRELLNRIAVVSPKVAEFETQSAAAVSLAQLHDDAGTARLKELLGSSDYETRSNVAGRLGTAKYFSEWRPPAALSHEPTREIMRHFAEHAPDTPTRLQLLEALGGQLDPPTREFLERLARNPANVMRWAAQRVLVRPNPNAYEEPLLAFLDNGDDYVRRDVVGFLAQVSTPRVTDRLLALTSDSDAELRVAAVTALAKHRSPKVDARLRELSTNDPSPHVRARILRVLATTAANSDNARSDAGTDDKPHAEGPLSRIEVFARKVSLRANEMPLKLALAELARQARVELQLDVEALKKVELDVDEPVTATFTDEPLGEAIGLLIDWRDHYGAFTELRAGQLVLTTIDAMQERIARELPDWLKPLYTQGLSATLDEDRQVVSITSSRVMTDELLEKVKTLPKLRELSIEGTKTITPAGLKHLGQLRQLETLSLYSVNDEGHGLGDAAMQAVAGLKSLREVRISECGLTDAGARLLEGLPQLTRLELGEARLTDAALTSIGQLKNLKHLGLSSYGSTVQYGRMYFTAKGLRSLAGLRDLEELHLVGQEVTADLLSFPKLTALSLGGSSGDDACAERIAACRDLKSLSLVYSQVTDAGLKQIATLPSLRQLNIDSHVITDAGIEHLKALKSLELLTLRASRLTDDTLRHVSEMKLLTRLDLHGSGESGSVVGERFTTNALRQLKELPKLRTLYLTNWNSPGGFRALADLTQLREISLMMCNLTEEELNTLEEALPHTTIHHMTGGGSLGRLPKSLRKAKGSGGP